MTETPKNCGISAGDTVAITDTTGGVVESVFYAYDGVRFKIAGYPTAFQTAECHARGSRNPSGWTRTIEVIERAPVPWQAGDIARHRDGSTRIRQTNEEWFRPDGSRDCCSDQYADSNYEPIVRGGKRVTP